MWLISAVSTLKQFRRRRHRWVALFSIALMMFNQVALARHLCIDAAMLQSATAAVAGVHSPCHGGALGTTVAPADLERIACVAHCGEADKQVLDLVAANIPFLAGSDVAQLRPVESTMAKPSQTETRIERRSRHTIDHSVLLI
jgi:hypothetical protein